MYCESFVLVIILSSIWNHLQRYFLQRQLHTELLNYFFGTSANWPMGNEFIFTKFWKNE